MLKIIYYFIKVCQLIIFLFNFIFGNNDKINIEVDNPNDVLYQYMQNSNLTFEKLLTYARETNNQKVLTKIWDLAR